MRRSPSPAAAIVLAGLEVAGDGADSADEEMHGALATERARLENRLAFWERSATTRRSSVSSGPWSVSSLRSSG